MERLDTFIVTVVLNDGQRLFKNKLGNTKWHAIDKVYSDFCSVQPDRAKYSAKRTFKKV